MSPPWSPGLSLTSFSFLSIVVEFAKESRPRREPYDGDRSYGYARHLQRLYSVFNNLCLALPVLAGLRESVSPSQASHVIQAGRYGLGSVRSVVFSVLGCLLGYPRSQRSLLSSVAWPWPSVYRDSFLFIRSVSVGHFSRG